MVSVDYIVIFFTFPNTFDRLKAEHAVVKN